MGKRTEFFFPNISPRWQIHPGTLAVFHEYVQTNSMLLAEKFKKVEDRPVRVNHIISK
ncbi:hypothetical protein ACIGC1_15800 [Peribacillus butanolivorans]|uniref:hypothetical protein n=1 Tax=Peribacillus butanolivorans TaxID=421767 RepID=UPI0037C69C28